MTTRPRAPAESGSSSPALGTATPPEYMSASLGREFRREARKVQAEAFVITGNADGSLKLTKSRGLEASGLAFTIGRVSVFLMAGLIGIVAIVKSAKATAHAAHSISRMSGPMSSAPTIHRIGKMNPIQNSQ